MRTLLVTIPGQPTKTVTDREVMEHSANQTCNQYGWSIRSAAWHDLASTARAADAFLVQHAQVMYPGATVEVRAAA